VLEGGTLPFLCGIRRIMGLHSSQALYQLSVALLAFLALSLWRKSVAAFHACYYQYSLNIHGDEWRRFRCAHSLIIIDKSVCIPSLSEYRQSSSHPKTTPMPSRHLFYIHILPRSEVSAVIQKKRRDMLCTNAEFRIPFPDVLQGCPDSLSTAHLRWCM